MLGLFYLLVPITLVHRAYASPEWTSLFKGNISAGRDLVKIIEDPSCGHEVPVLSMQEIKQLGFTLDYSRGKESARWTLKAYHSLKNSYDVTIDFGTGKIWLFGVNRTPPRPYSSQIIASFWSNLAALTTTIPDASKSLSGAVHLPVGNFRAAAIIKEILTVHNLQKSGDVNLPCAYGSDEYYALISTPPGRQHAYSLFQHRSVFGGKRIEKVVITGFSNAPNLEFVFKPLESEDPTSALQGSSPVTMSSG